MERLKDARTIAAKRRVRSAAMTKDRRLIIAATALLDSGAREPSPSGRSAMLPESLTMLPTSILRAGCVTDSHNTKFTLRSHNEEEIQDPNRLGNCLCRLTRRTVPRKKTDCRWSR